MKVYVVSAFNYVAGQNLLLKIFDNEDAARRFTLYGMMILREKMNGAVLIGLRKKFALTLNLTFFLMKPIIF